MWHLLMAQQQESFLPFSMAAKSLPLPKPRGKKKHSKTSWSSLLSFRTEWSFSPLQNHMDLYLSTCFRASWFSHLLQSRVVYSFFQSCMVSSFSPITLWSSLLFEAAWSLSYFRAAWSLLPFRATWSLFPSEPHGLSSSLQSHMVSSSLPSPMVSLLSEPHGLSSPYGCRA